MEDELDEVATEDKDWKNVVRDFYLPFDKSLVAATASIEKVKLADEVTNETCPECGKVCHHARGLGIHRHSAHGVTPKYQQQNAAYRGRAKRGRGRPRGRKAAPQDQAGNGAPDIKGAFEAAAQALRQADSLVNACLDGLDSLVTQSLKLRRAYIGKADRLSKLQAQIADVKADGEDE
jgi:hypothetical protein